MVKKGIDVSHHQGEIDWNKVKQSGIDFAMIRACYGWDNDNQIDKQFWRNAKACEDLNIPYGLYHYSYAMNQDEALKEAKFFLRVIKGLNPTYPVAFDFEEESQLKLQKSLQLKIIDTFMNYLENNEYYTVLYMSASPMQALYNYSHDKLSKYDCWVAHIGVNKPAYTGNYGMWQYSWNGKIPGISRDVDLNEAYKDYDTIIRGMKCNNDKEPSINKDAVKKYVDSLSSGIDNLSNMIEELKKYIS